MNMLTFLLGRIRAAFTRLFGAFTTQPSTPSTSMDNTQSEDLERYVRFVEKRVILLKSRLGEETRRADALQLRLDSIRKLIHDFKLQHPTQQDAHQETPAGRG